MKVEGLIKVLEQFNPKAEVILSADEEGNGYNPMGDVDAHGSLGSIILYPNNAVQLVWNEDCSELEVE